MLLPKGGKLVRIGLCNTTRVGGEADDLIGTSAEWALDSCTGKAGTLATATLAFNMHALRLHFSEPGGRLDRVDLRLIS